MPITPDRCIVLGDPVFASTADPIRKELANNGVTISENTSIVLDHSANGSHIHTDPQTSTFSVKHPHFSNPVTASGPRGNQLLSNLNSAHLTQTMCGPIGTAQEKQIIEPSPGYGTIYFIKQIHTNPETGKAKATTIAKQYSQLVYLEEKGIHTLFLEGVTPEDLLELASFKKGTSFDKHTRPELDSIKETMNILKRNQTFTILLDSGIVYYTTNPKTSLYSTEESKETNRREATETVRVLNQASKISTVFNPGVREYAKQFAHFKQTQTKREDRVMANILQYYETPSKQGENVVLVFGQWHDFTDNLLRVFPENQHPGLVEVTLGVDPEGSWDTIMKLLSGEQNSK